MGAESSQEKQFSIDLKIDKQQYAIRDQIKGYIMCYANPFLHKEYNESFADYNLDLKLEFIAYFEQSYWESISQDYNRFIYQDNQIKNCILNREQKIRENVSFTYDLDLITSSGYGHTFFKINYSLRATVLSKNQIIGKKEINFLIYRPFVDIERPVSQEKQFIIKSLCCCNFGQISVKVSLNKTDFLKNDMTDILIECDQSLSTKNVQNIQIQLTSKLLYQDELTYPLHHQTIYSEASSDQKFKFIQKFSITSYQPFSHLSAINQSLDCPFFAQQYFIEINFSPGFLTESITCQLPIIIYKQYEQNLKDDINNIEIQESFNQDLYNEFQQNNFINFKIKQEKWKGQIMDFYDQNILLAQSQPEQDNNLIMIQKKQ